MHPQRFAQLFQQASPQIKAARAQLGRDFLSMEPGFACLHLEPTLRATMSRVFHVDGEALESLVSSLPSADAEQRRDALLNMLAFCLVLQANEMTDFFQGEA